LTDVRSCDNPWVSGTAPPLLSYVLILIATSVSFHSQPEGGTRVNARGATLSSTVPNFARKWTGTTYIVTNAERHATSTKVRCLSSMGHSILTSISGQMSERAWYSHRTRAFHLAYLEDYYCRVIDGTENAINPTLRINFMGGGVKITTPHPQDYTTFTERVETSMHNKQRFSDLWVEMGYAQNKLLKPLKNGSFFLYIETMYNWDNHGAALTLLVKLRGFRDPKTKKLTLQSEYSVPSVLYCID